MKHLLNHSPPWLGSVLVAGLAGMLASACVAPDPSAGAALGDTDFALATPAVVTTPALLSPSTVLSLQRTTEPASDERRRPPGDGDLFALAEGHWRGHCDIFVPGQADPVQSVGMERITEATGDPNEYTWTIIYHNPEVGEDIRNYTVLATETPGRYVIDEHNGIFLPAYLADGNVLVSEFQAPSFDIRVMSREVFKRNRYEIEFISMSMTPEEVSDSEVVIESFPVLSVQRCSLRRERGQR